MRILLSAAVLALCAGVLSAATIHVPADQPTIQAGIDVAINGDTAFDNTGMSTMSPNTPDFWTWTLGDLDHSHAVDISDLVMLVDYMFNSGPAPYLLFLADIDGSCSIDISDLVYLVDYMFAGGPAPLVGCEPE